MLDFYYSGHGHVGYMFFSRNEPLFYDNFIDHIATKVDKHVETLYLEGLEPKQFKDRSNQKRTGVGYFFNIYVDACHSGSALDYG